MSDRYLTFDSDGRFGLTETPGGAYSRCDDLGGPSQTTRYFQSSEGRQIYMQLQPQVDDLQYEAAMLEAVLDDIKTVRGAKSNLRMARVAKRAKTVERACGSWRVRL